MSIASLVDQASLLCVLAGLLAGAATLASVRRTTLAVAVALELWTAAGLLRLTGEPSMRAVATAAGVLLVRRLVTINLGPGAPGARGRGPHLALSSRPSFSARKDSDGR